MESTQRMRNYIIKQLKVTPAEMRNIGIERAHRIGTPKRGKARPIIAKFSFFKEKEYIRSQAKNLSGTNFGLAEDYPKEILQVRKELIPNLREAKEKGKKASIRFDKLIVDGKLFAGKAKLQSYRCL